MPVQWTSADGRTITINANQNASLPSHADIIEICLCKTLDKGVEEELVKLSHNLIKFAGQKLDKVTADYKASRDALRNGERLQSWASGLVIAHTILEHFSKRPQLLAEGKEIVGTLGPTTVQQALNDWHVACVASDGLAFFMNRTEMTPADVGRLFRWVPPPEATEPPQSRQPSQAPQAPSPSSRGDPSPTTQPLDAVEARGAALLAASSVAEPSASSSKRTATDQRDRNEADGDESDAEESQEPDESELSRESEQSDESQEADEESQESDEPLVAGRAQQDRRGVAKGKRKAKAKGKRQAKGKRKQAQKSARPQKYVSSREEVIKEHVKKCSNCKKARAECVRADPETHFIKCELCVSDKRSDPPCDHKEWLDPTRIRKYFELRETKGKTKREAAAIIYGKLAFFGDAQHDKVPLEKYMVLPSDFRKKYCRSELWDAPKAASATAAATHEPPVGRQPAASEPAVASSSRIHSPPPPPPPFPRERAWTPPHYDRDPQHRQQDDSAGTSFARFPPTPTPKRRAPFSADNTPVSKRFKRWPEDSPEPDRRNSLSLYEGRETFVSEAHFFFTMRETFFKFLDDYVSHSYAEVTTPEEKEVALSGLKDDVLDKLWQLLNCRGRSFRQVFGILSERRVTRAGNPVRQP